MLYQMNYHSPIGRLLLVSDETALIGLWIEGQKYYLSHIQEPLTTQPHIAILQQTKQWLDRYFQGQQPSLSTLTLQPRGTEFQKNVWKLLCDIPYGQTTTYKELAQKIAKQRGISQMSAQAIGGAVGHNPISIIIPCHRVIGTHGSLTGYAGGLDKKIALLKHEHVNMQSFFIPSQKTAL